MFEKHWLGGFFLKQYAFDYWIFSSQALSQSNIIIYILFLDKALKEIVERVFQSNYFDSTHNHQNGLCEEEEAASAPPAEDQVTEAGEYVRR